MSRILRNEWEKKDYLNKHLPEGMVLWTVPRKDYDRVVCLEVAKDLWEELDKTHMEDVRKFNEENAPRYHVDENGLWSSTLKDFGLEYTDAAQIGGLLKYHRNVLEVV